MIDVNKDGKVYAEIQKHVYDNGDRLLLTLEHVHYAGFKPGYNLELRFLEKVVEKDDEDKHSKIYFNSWYTQHFKVEDLRMALIAFKARLESKSPWAPCSQDSSVYDVFEREEKCKA